MPASFALPVAPAGLPWAVLPGIAPVTTAWAMGPDGKVPLASVDLAAGFDGVFIVIPQRQMGTFRQRLQATMDTQRVVMGPGLVIVTEWEGETSSVVGVLETAHANVGLTALEEVAVREGLLPDAYIIGVSVDQIQRLASDEVQQRILHPIG